MQHFPQHPARHFTGGTREAVIPDDLWLKCSACREMIYRRQFQDALKVCPRCDHHSRLSAAEWLDLLLDPCTFDEHEATLEPMDPLGFVSMDTPYKEKLQQMQARTNATEALICGSGTIAGLPVELTIANFDFMGGSMGSVYGEKVACAVERATARGVPLITINASGGARMQEGILSLMQMAKVAVAFSLLAQARQLHISVLVDPCYGGVSASYASLADIVLAEPGARIGFTGPRVVAQTTRQPLPPNFQKAEYLMEHGMLDAIVHRSALRQTLARLLQTHARPWKRVHDEGL